MKNCFGGLEIARRCFRLFARVEEAAARAWRRAVVRTEPPLPFFGDAELPEFNRIHLNPLLRDSDVNEVLERFVGFVKRAFYLARHFQKLIEFRKYDEGKGDPTDAKTYCDNDAAENRESGDARPDVADVGDEKAVHNANSRGSGIGITS